jgi:hypothetical protein
MRLAPPDVKVEKMSPKRLVLYLDMSSKKPALSYVAEDLFLSSYS